MRLTVPNPLGQPFALDTDRFLQLPTRLPRLSLTHRRPQLRLIILILSLISFVLYRPSPPFPPAYADEYRIEDSFPHLYGPEGREGRYLKFDVPRGTGFNHQLQRVLLQHHLAVLANRSLAFEPYVEDDTWMSFRWDRWPWRSARIPLSAYISTPINGFEQYSSAPRAVP